MIKNFKAKLIVSLISMGLISLLLNPLLNEVKAQSSVTFEEQFPNPHTAEVMASYFGKAVTDVIDDTDLSTSSLSLDSQELTDITGITIFTELSGLFLDNNQLTKLPDNFNELSNLRLISLSNNQLTSLPDSFLTMVSRFSYLGLEGNLLPSDYEVVIQENGNSHSYLTQDKLVVDPLSNTVTIRSYADYESLDYPLLTNLQSVNELSSAHIYMLENYVDENMEPVNIDDYFFSNGAVRKSGKVYAQVRATGTGVFPNTSDNALTDDYIELNFEVILYNLSFDLNGGGSSTPASQILSEGEKGVQPDNPTREGYTFSGWNTSADGSGYIWNFDSNTMPAEDVVLYAQWEENTLPKTGITRNVMLFSTLVVLVGAKLILINKKY